MTDQHSSYYIPKYSVWPIIGAIGLFLIGLGSINIFEPGLLGPILFISGAVILILTLIGWISAVLIESRQGLYDTQMDRTFRWGMIWFLFTDSMMFLAFIGALWYFRFFTIPWLAGQANVLDTGITHLILWPNFNEAWPLLKNPDPSQFIGPQQGLSGWGIPALNTMLLISSAMTLILGYFGVRRNHQGLLITGVLLTFLLGCLFLTLQLNAYREAIVHFGITLSSGIYGSTVLTIIALHMLHIIIGLILLFTIFVRACLNHFNSEKYFMVQATMWFWSLISIVWMIAFLSIYL